MNAFSGRTGCSWSGLGELWQLMLQPHHLLAHNQVGVDVAQLRLSIMYVRGRGAQSGRLGCHKFIADCSMISAHLFSFDNA